MYARLDGFSSQRAAYSRLPDFPEMRVWQDWLGSESLFVDVGANIGLYSMVAAEAGAAVIRSNPNETQSRSSDATRR